MDILERKVIHAGKKISSNTEDHHYAYIIQKGLVQAYITDKNKRIEIATYGPDTIIGETNLMLDDPGQVEYEALEDTTVVVIIRQDFEKSLKKVNKVLLSIIKTMMKKLHQYERQSVAEALEEKQTDDKAREIVDHLLREMGPERREKYETILLPHFNVMCRALEDLKTQERHEKQKKDLEGSVSKARGEGEDTIAEEHDNSALDDIDDIDTFSEAADDKD